MTVSVNAPDRALPRVYATFDATASKNPALTDLKYYFLLRAWLRHGPLAGRFIDVHDQAPRGKPVDLRAELRRRLASSDMLLLILSERTRRSEGWVTWEIETGAGELRLPVVCGYVGRSLTPPDPRRGEPAWWPEALRRVLGAAPVQARHVAFRPGALAAEMGTAPGASQKSRYR